MCNYELWIHAWKLVLYIKLKFGESFKENKFLEFMLQDLVVYDYEADVTVLNRMVNILVYKLQHKLKWVYIWLNCFGNCASNEMLLMIWFDWETDVYAYAPLRRVETEKLK